jgi:hypothetical protein
MDASWRLAVGRIYVRLNYLTPTCSRVGEKKKCPISNYLNTCSRVGVGPDRLEAPVPAEPSTSAPLQLQQSPAHGSNDRFVSCTGSTFGLHQTVVIRQVCWYVPCTFYICSAGSLTSSRAALVRIASLGAWTLPERIFVSSPRRYQHTREFGNMSKRYPSDRGQKEKAIKRIGENQLISNHPCAM